MSKRPPPAPDLTRFDVKSAPKEDVLEYHSRTGSFRASFDHNKREIFDAVASTVAVAAETPLEDLPPLYSSLDPDALEALIKSAYERDEGDIEVTFTYARFEVTVKSYGILQIKPLDRLSREN